MIEVVTIKRDDAHVGECHQHAQAQLFIVEHGSFAFETPLGRWIMPVLRAGWVPPNYEHHAESFGPMHVISIYIANEHCKHLTCEPCVFTPSPLLSCIVKTMSHWPEGTPWDISKDNILKVLIDELKTIKPEPLYVPVPKDKNLNKVAAQIIQEPSLHKTLDEWAQLANLSRRSFTRKFKDMTGLSFVQWQCQVKVVKACEYFARGMSVTQTAYALGFSQISSFSQLFKKYLGVSPKQYMMISNSACVV